MTVPTWMQTHLLSFIVIVGTQADSSVETDDERRVTMKVPTEETSDQGASIAIVVLSLVCAAAVTGLIVVLLLYFKRERARTQNVTSEDPEEAKYYEISDWYEFISLRRISRKSGHYARRIEKTQGGNGSASSRPIDGKTAENAEDQIYENYELNTESYKV